MRFVKRIAHIFYLLKLSCRNMVLHFPGAHVNKIHFILIEKKRISSIFRSVQQATQSTSLILTPPHKNTNTEILDGDKVGFASDGSWRVTFFFHREILRNNFRMEHEMAKAYESSARHFGHHTCFLDTLYAREFIKPENLSEVFLDLDTTHLIILGDTKLNEHPGMSKELLRMLRARNVKIIVILMDLLFSSSSMGIELVDFWKNEADAIVVHNSRILEYFPKLNNVLLWPSLPYVETESIFQSVTEKSIELLIPGSGHRQRQLFSNYAKRHGIKVVSELSSRDSHVSQVYLWENYIHRLKEAKLVFTNGYRNGRESQVIARTTEVMLSKSVLMYEKGSDIDYFFTPYSDYIPVNSLPDLVDKANFLLENDSLRNQITDNAYSALLTKYSYRNFWQSLGHVINSGTHNPSE